MITFKDFAKNFELPQITLSTPVYIIDKEYTPHSIMSKEEDSFGEGKVYFSELNISYTIEETETFLIDEAIVKWMEKNLDFDPIIKKAFWESYRKPYPAFPFKSLIRDYLLFLKNGETEFFTEETFNKIFS